VPRTTSVALNCAGFATTTAGDDDPPPPQPARLRTAVKMATATEDLAFMEFLMGKIDEPATLLEVSARITFTFVFLCYNFNLDGLKRLARNTTRQNQK
jgi:hypothetical protein